MYAVAIQATALCVYDTETQQEIACASLEPLDADRFEDVVWSPIAPGLRLPSRGSVLARTAIFG